MVTYNYLLLTFFQCKDFSNVVKEIKGPNPDIFILVLSKVRSYFSYISKPPKYLILLSQYKETSQLSVWKFEKVCEWFRKPILIWAQFH